MKGDLETIALKALAKNRVKRYQSANDIEEDLKRYINDDPISARPPSLLDHLFRFVRKNTLKASLIFSLLTVVVAVATAGGWLRASFDRDRANVQAERVGKMYSTVNRLRTESQEFELEAIKGRVATLVSTGSMLDLLESFVNEEDWPAGQLPIRPNHFPNVIFSHGYHSAQTVVRVPIEGMLGIRAEGAGEAAREEYLGDIRPDILEKLLEDISYRPRVKVIVFDFDTGGGMVTMTKNHIGKMIRTNWQLPCRPIFFINERFQ